MFDDITVGRFWGNVQMGGPDECWPWLGSKRQQGYGSFHVNRTNYVASRFSLALKDESFPPKMDARNPIVARHKCDNPACVNPGHLEAGSHAQNVWDMFERGRNVDFIDHTFNCPKLAQIADRKRAALGLGPAKRAAKVARLTTGDRDE